MCFSRFSRKKAKIDALMNVNHSIKLQLETFVSHLRTVQLSYDILVKQNVEIMKLLKENKKNEWRTETF